MSYGEIGIITYDEQYNATWINDFLEERHIDIVGKKLTSLDFTNFGIYLIVDGIVGIGIVVER